MKLKLGAKPDTELVSFPATRGFRWTTRRVAAGMVGVAAAGGLVDALGWAQAWMPNVVVGSLTVAVTITVVERALRNDDRARYQPILNVIRTRLDLQMIGFAYSLLHDYSVTHLETNKPIPATLEGLCRLWLDGTADTPRPDRPTGQYLPLLNESRELADHLNAARARYAFLVDQSPLLVDAIERFSEWVAQASFALEREKPPYNVAMTPQYETVLLTRIVESTQNLAKVLSTEASIELRISDEQRSAAADWNLQGRQLVAQRAGQPIPEPKNPRDELERDAE